MFPRERRRGKESFPLVSVHRTLPSEADLRVSPIIKSGQYSCSSVELQVVSDKVSTSANGFKASRDLREASTGYRPNLPGLQGIANARL